MARDTHLVSELTDEERIELRTRLRCVSPDDGKYYSKKLADYLSAEAEWVACANVQMELLKTRMEFGQAEEKHVDELAVALHRIDPLNMSLLEKKVTHHDQLAVIEDLGRHVSEETKSLLHPGTTSYDILDTARSYLLKSAWNNVIRPKTSEVIGKLCDLAEVYKNVFQAGRTHLQITSPVPFDSTLAGYAARLASRVEKSDAAFNDLRGKISGIVGTGAGIEIVIGEGKGERFEKEVLKKLYLKPDTTATQIVHKERVCDVGHSIVGLMYVLADFANDMRLLYSTEIAEVTSRANAQRLGGSSADASKNNPINWENIAGKAAVVESGMRVLYASMQSDLQRDLRNSVQARYQPNQMIAQTYESFCRASRSLDQLSVNKDNMEENLDRVRRFPSEALVAITRAHGYVHPEYGVGHSAVKEFAKAAKQSGRPLMDVATEDDHFNEFYQGLSDKEIRILNGALHEYIGFADKRAKKNIRYARRVCSRSS